MSKLFILGIILILIVMVLAISEPSRQVWIESKVYCETHGGVWIEPTLLIWACHDSYIVDRNGWI